MSKVVFSPIKLIATIAAIVLSLPTSAQWNNIAPNNAGQSIKFVSSTIGYLQNVWTMQKTTDGGVTWVTIDSVSGALSQNGMFWLNANEGFAVYSENLGFGNYAGWFKKTVNGGASWSVIQNISPSEALNAIWFTSSTTGFVVGGGGVIRKTINGGTSWTTLTSTTTLDLYSIEFANATTGWVGGDDGIILKTINASTWTQQFSSIFYEFQDIAFTDPLNGCATGTYGLLRTTNGGTNWNPVAVYGTYQFLSIDFPSADTGYMTGVAGNVFRTIDGGASWIGLNSIPPGYMVRDCDFISNDTGYVTVDFAGTWKTTNAGSGCPTLLVQNTITMPDTIRACANSTALFTAAASALNPYVFNVSPSWVWDTAMSYGQYYYVSDSIANDTLQIIITMTDTTTGCGMLTDFVVLVTDSTTYQPLSQPTWLFSLCPGDSIVLDLGAGAEDGYSWQMSQDSTQTLTVDTVGMYTGMAFACGNTYNYFFFIQWDTNCVQQACSVNAGPDTVFCQQQGQLQAIPGGAGTYSYVWSPSNGLDNPYVANPNVISGVNNQQYVVTITDLNSGCTASDTVVISAYYFSTMSDTILLCPTNSVVLNMGPGGSNYLYQQWTDTLGNVTTLNIAAQSMVATQPGTYVGFATFPGCGTLTNVFNVVSGCDTCGVYAGPDTVFCQQMGQLTATPLVPNPNYIYTWSPSTGLNNPNIQSPIVTSPVHNQQYVVTMVDPFGICVATDTVIVSAYYWNIDTMYMCQGQPITYDIGPGAIQYSVQFTDTSGNFQSSFFSNNLYIITQPANYIFVATYPGCGALTSVITVIDSCYAAYVPSVWPGDCNYDLVVNMADALHIGLGYGATDAVRPNATNGWYAQPMLDWNQNYLNCNYKHGDANGDGTINVGDTLPIALNYSLTHPFRYEQPEVIATAPSLTLVCAPDTVGLQTLVQVDVVLGTASLPIDSLYGISFRITSEAFLIDTNLTVINANNSWLGNAGTDLFTFQKHFLSNAVIDFAEVKNNHLNTVNGNGVIATFFIVTTDNLSGIETCNFDLSDITAITESQTYIPMNPVNDSVVIDPSVMPGFNEYELTLTFSMYPNPANDKVTIQTTSASDVIEICDMSGRVVRTIAPNGNVTVIETSALANGIYLVNVKNGTSVVTQKLTISR